MGITISVENKSKTVIVNIKAEGILSSTDVTNISNKIEEMLDKGEIDTSKTIIVSGRLPTWGYAAAVHALHPARAVAVYLPRNKAAVIVSGVDVGKMIDVDGNPVESAGDKVEPAIEVIREEKVNIVKIGIPSRNADIAYLIKSIEAREIDVEHGKPVVLYGAAPVAIYAYLTARLQHISPAIMVYDPKIPGAVVAVSHSAEYKPGEVVKVKVEEKKQARTATAGPETRVAATQ